MSSMYPMHTIRFKHVINNIIDQKSVVNPLGFVTIKDLATFQRSTITYDYPNQQLKHNQASPSQNRTYNTHYVKNDIQPHMWSGRFATLQLKCVAKRSLAILENVPECFGHTYYWSRDHCRYFSPHF